MGGRITSDYTHTIATNDESEYFRGTFVCFESLYKAERYTELLELLQSRNFRFDFYQAYAVKTLLKLNRNDEALPIIDECRRISRNGTAAIDQVLVDFNLAPPPVEFIYGPDACKALRKGTYIGWYKAVAEKFPEKQPAEILEALIASTPGEEGKWFTTAKDLGMLQLAIRLANTSLCDPSTLARAARDYLDTDPQFAMDAGKAALSIGICRAMVLMLMMSAAHLIPH